MGHKNTLRVFAAYLIGFFLIVTILTAFFIIPKINETTKRQHLRDTAATLQIEAELFKRFIDRHAQILNDLASFPVVTNAVLLSSGNNPNLVDIIDNFSITGERSAILLQNIEGTVIYHTTEGTSDALAGDSQSFLDVLEGKKAYHFKLLAQKKDELRFIVSVPVIYQNTIEGVLSARIAVPISSIFSPQLVGQDVVLKIRQNKIVAQTQAINIKIPKAFIRKIPQINVEMVYVEDQTKIIAEQADLRNRIILILLAGFVISFLMFLLLGYRALSQEDRESYTLSKKAYVMPVGVGFLGIAASVLAAYFFSITEKESVNEDISRLNQLTIDKIEDAMSDKLSVLNYLAGLHESSSNVTLDEFKKFTQKIYDAKQNIQALEWVPVVKESERPALESQMREKGFRNYEIREYGPNGTLIPARKRPLYYPVMYLEPFKGNEIAHGFDVGSHVLRKEALMNAQELGQAAASSAISLLQGKEKQKGLYIFNPVYRSKIAGERKVTGFVLGVFNLKGVFETAKRGGLNDVFLLVEDVSQPNAPDVLYSSTKNVRAKTDHINIRYMDVAGRSWKITAYPNPAKVVRQGKLLPLSILLGGIIFSLFVSYSLLQLVRRRHITEAVVIERTKEVRELTDAMEQSVEGVSRINPQGKYVYVNEAYAQTCGYRPSELVGQNWEITVHKDDHAKMQQAYEIMLDIGKVTEEPSGVRKDGSIFYKRVTMISQFDEKGEFIGHHCFMSDISERKEAELELIRSNQDLDDFAYIASHDLKEPLRGIHNHAKLFIEDHKSELDEDGRHRLGRITYLSQRMESLINDLLYYSRLGRERAAFQETDLNEIVIEEQKLLLDQDNVVVTLVDKLPVMTVDKTRVSELFRNLISNGIKYNDSEVKNIAIGLQNNAPSDIEVTPVFYVKDNGIGIDKRFHADIFKIFKRLHKKDAYGGGTGSGLTFVKKIIDQHKGKIWIESEPGEGTAFYFTLGGKRRGATRAR